MNFRISIFWCRTFKLEYVSICYVLFDSYLIAPSGW